MEDRSTAPATLADLDALEARLTAALREAVAAFEAARIADKALLEWRLEQVGKIPMAEVERILLSGRTKQVNAAEKALSSLSRRVGRG